MSSTREKMCRNTSLFLLAAPYEVVEHVAGHTVLQCPEAPESCSVTLYHSPGFTPKQELEQRKSFFSQLAASEDRINCVQAKPPPLSPAPCHTAEARSAPRPRTSDDNPPPSRYRGFGGRPPPQSVSRHPHSRTCLFERRTQIVDYL